MPTSSDLALSARGVTKRYRIRTADPDATRGRLVKRTFTALDNVDFDVVRGEVVALIGRNGAGKSTLLKALSRITAIDGGVIDVWGRVGSLLEVGTGFHAELTGRENVYLNGAILGMRRPEIAAQFDSIVEFADIGPFIDTPVKRYSSGMQVRLAFAVAAHLNPEILFVDEVLAVGDAEFQKRCLGKLNEVATEQGRTVILVSHNMAAVEHLCSRGVLMEHGRVAFDGPAPEAIARYFDLGAGPTSVGDVGVFAVDGRHVERVTTKSGDVPLGQFLTGQPLTVLIDVRNMASVKRPVFTVQVRTDLERTVFTASTRMKPLGVVPPYDSAQVQLHVSELPLMPGRYWLDVIVNGEHENKAREVNERAASLDIVGSTNVLGTGYQFDASDGLIYVDHAWTLESQDVIAPDAPR